MRPVRISSKLLVRDTDPLVSEHRVQDIHILPGVSMLDATYKVLAAARIDTDALVLRDILFHEPVVTNAEMDRKLTVTVEHQGEHGRVTVTSVPWKGDQPLSDKVTSHMTCVYRNAGPMDLPPLPSDLHRFLGEPVDLDACYSVTRHIGIFHESFMKCLGEVAPLLPGGFVGTVSLGERAAARAADFMLHPVFLDCSTIVPLFHLRERLDEAALFIPFAIDEFRARSLKGHRQVRVLVERPDADIAGREVLSHSFSLYGMDGQPLVRVGKFGVKRVRSLESIRRLLARAGAVPSPVLQLVPAAPRAEAPTSAPAEPQGDSLVSLIASLVTRHGQVEWSDADVDKSFFDLGLDSVALLEISEAMEKELKVQLYPTLLFERSTATALAGYLREKYPHLAGTGETAPAPQRAEPAAPVAAQLSATTPQVWVPRWLPVNEGERARAGQTLALVGDTQDSGLSAKLAEHLGTRLCFNAASEGGTQAVASFIAALEQGLRCDEVWLVGLGHAAAIALVRALVASGRLQSPLVLKALSVRGFSIHREAPAEEASHGLWGLLQSLSREYPAVRVSQVDVEREDLERGELQCVDQVGSRPRELRALRAGRLYERRLLSTRPTASAPVPLRQDGVYFIVGGAGGVGMEFLRHLRRTYNARVAVSGRRALTDDLRRQLSEEGVYGEQVLYVQAAVEDASAMAEALQQVRARWGALHGVVHSAMVLEDKRLVDLDEAAFARVLAPKVAGTQALARATEGLELDFLLFFSSIQSFVGNVSQGNYATASTFLDGYASALRARRSHRVVVINWGYWSEVGAVANDIYRTLLARQGIHGLRAAEAFATLEQVLAAGWDQAAILAAEDTVLEELGASWEWELGRSAQPSAVEPPPRALTTEVTAEFRPAFAQMQQAMDALLPLARRRVAQVLRELGLLGDRALLVDEAVRAGSLAREHARLAQALLKLPGLAEAEGLGAQPFNEAATALAQAHPPLRHMLPLLQACLDAYPLILAGKRPAAHVVFPGGSVELVRSVYGESELSRFYNQAVSKAVLGLAASRGERPLRILEVGAGTGSTTVEILRALAGAGMPCEYRYTDVWDKLLAEAKSRLGPQHPSLRFSLLDVNTAPQAQGLDEEFDVVVATNVLHATRDLHTTLRHVKKLLRPGGALVLNESVDVQEFSTCTFGLLPGWWGAVDAHERLPDSPLVSSAGWTALMKDEGFEVASPLIPADPTLPSLGSQQVFVAWSDGEVKVASARRPARQEEAHRRQLPRALEGHLRPLDLHTTAGGALPRSRQLALYQDTRDNLWLFFDNPPANVLTDELLGDLCTTFQRLSELAPEVIHKRIVYLAHFGEYFSIGGDRNEILRRLAMGEKEALRGFADKARTMLRLLATMDALVVAVVNGTAQGGGLETLFATDLQLVRQGVKVGLPEIKSGLIPGMGGLSYLKGLAGMTVTKRLVLSGELLTAQEAQQLGLITHVVEDPFTSALELPQTLQQLDTALYMKRVLGEDTAERLTADIDEWLTYTLGRTELIDAQRILDSQLILNSRAATAQANGRTHAEGNRR
ncbi:polyketide synthase [Myxococcus stipitatus DSM 14675]|uniref:Polyketide synthase n=1 Tax=Myxococcus stipitatus (strain DSM 14675 / JCM 12634 / Mx s8) TaxID=1278073 RepID=L7U6J9_MYXSD|nr:SDR family NAD(P)-dependent oxidoreductase [Myxococcus stipitatus]AGC43222.1 polyketide synthase [Myxococcus stipitatus DSM 14675]